MSQEAQIRSIGTLRHLRACLTKFAEVASAALEETSGDVQHTLLWLRESQYGYWKKQVQKRSELHSQAKLALKRKEIFDRVIAGNPSSCVDEKKALKRAEARLQEAQYKLRQVKVWVTRIEKEMSDYRAAVQRLSHDLEVRIPNARARLDKMTDSLDAYVALAPPEAPTRAEETTADTAASTVVNQPADERAQATHSLQERAGRLRDQVPPPEARREVALDAEAGAWIGGRTCSESLLEAARKIRTQQAAPGPHDRVVLARVKKGPDTIFLTRAAPGAGDSGWYIGADGDAALEGYVAAQVGDLVQACPALADIFNLPEGHAVLIDVGKGWEAILDRDDRVLWCNLDGGASAGEE
jgi:hypothetical protein